jgi:hypothetical protein
MAHNLLVRVQGRLQIKCGDDGSVGWTAWASDGDHPSSAVCGGVFDAPATKYSVGLSTRPWPVGSPRSVNHVMIGIAGCANAGPSESVACDATQWTNWLENLDEGQVSWTHTAVYAGEHAPAVRVALKY